MRVCVFGSSSRNTPAPYLEAANELGMLIASRGYTCVNGGGNAGVMGSLNDSCHKHGSKIIGVIHQMFCVDGSEDRNIKNMIVCGGSDLKERKKTLVENSDCIIVLPGGTGTFDELWDVVSTKSLGMGGLRHTPICLVNIQGFYDGTILQLERAFKDGLLYLEVSKYFHVCNTAVEAISYCEAEYSGNPLESVIEEEVSHAATTGSGDSRISILAETATTLS